MVLAAEARKISLPLGPSPSSISFASPFPPRLSSFLFDPNSLSLALMLADSSISLFSPLSVFSVSSPTSLPPPQTLIPAPSSSACFLRFRTSSNSKPLTLFVAAGPSHGGSRVLIRFLVQSKEAAEFVPVQIGCGQRGLEFDRKSGGVLVDCSHGLKVVLAGSVNYFAMYSASAAKVWVFGVKTAAEDQGNANYGGVGVNLRLVKCALIDCQALVTAMSLSSEFLIMGELNGVRVFPLRLLVKGLLDRKKKTKKLPLRIGIKENENLEGNVEIKLQNSNLPNGFDRGQDVRYDITKNKLIQAKLKVIAQKNAVGMPRLAPNGVMGAQIHGTPAFSGSPYGLNLSTLSSSIFLVKPKSQRLSQDSDKWGALFLPFNSKDEGLPARKTPYLTKKAISIHGFLQNKFLVADSDGSVHILCASISGPSIMKQLSNIKEVQQIAVLPDLSDESQTVWLSDGYHSVHVMAEPDVSTSSNLKKSDSDDIRLSVVQTIFMSESIRDVQPLSANAVLILGQVISKSDSVAEGLTHVFGLLDGSYSLLYDWVLQSPFCNCQSTFLLGTQASSEFKSYTLIQFDT
ncbi:hypothetical protein V2J09_023346 [Rumex salicifolius]